VLVVDDFYYSFWKFFLKNKPDMKAKIINFLTDLKITDFKVKFICSGNALENRSMKNDLNVKGLEPNLSPQDLGHLRKTAKLRESFKFSMERFYQS
jgi:hypothetical protein